MHISTIDFKRYDPFKELKDSQNYVIAGEVETSFDCTYQWRLQLSLQLSYIIDILTNFLNQVKPFAICFTTKDVSTVSLYL